MVNIIFMTSHSILVTYISFSSRPNITFLEIYHSSFVSELIAVNHYGILEADDLLIVNMNTNIYLKNSKKSHL